MNSEEMRLDETDSTLVKIKGYFQNNLSLTTRYIIFYILVWIVPLVASKLIGFALPSLPAAAYIVGSLLFWELGTLFTTRQFLKASGHQLSQGSFAVIIYCTFVFYTTIPKYSLITFVNSDPVFIEIVNSAGYRLGIPCLLLMLCLPTHPQKTSD